MKKAAKKADQKPIIYIVDGERVSPNGLPVDEDGFELPQVKKRERQIPETIEVVPGQELDRADAEALYLPALRELIRKTFGGEHIYLQRLRAVHSLLLPEQSAHVERAMEVYQLMRKFSYVVMPSRNDSSTLLRGAVKLRTDVQAKKSANYKLAKKYWKPRMTLQSLAIQTFLRELPQARNLQRFDERTVKRDLQKLRQLTLSDSNVRVHHEIALANGETLPYFFYTDKWKRRRLQAKSDKTSR